jgi:hypothetical protein
MNKQEYNALLANNICEVHFTKKDGTTRIMVCTLKPSLIESNIGALPAGVVNVPEHQVRCIDVQKQAWRSFTIDSVTDFKVVMPV